MKRPKVSIIMPTYGRTDFLQQAIDGVYGQTFHDFEYIVVDDNDPSSSYRKETENIIAAQRANGRDIIYVQHERNKNGSAARNTGFFHSKGQYISFLDSDDIYCPRRLEVAVSILENAEDHVGGVYTGVEFRRGGKTYGIHTDVHPGNFLVETLACVFLIGTGSNLFIRRSIVEELKGFDEAFIRHQDYEFLVRFFEKYDMAAVKDVLVIKNNENFNFPGFKKSYAIKQQYFRKFRPVIDRLDTRDKDYIFGMNYASLGEWALKDGLRKEAKDMYDVAEQHVTIGMRMRLRRLAFWLLSWFR